MPSIANPLPPCIVLGLETQIGLSIVRELGRAGVPVIGIALEPDAIGLSSRYLARRLIAPSPRSPELVSMIRKLGDELGSCCLITVSEANLLWLENHEDEFGKVKPILPPKAALETVLDKGKTLEIARALNINIPKTIEPASLDDAERMVAHFRYPVVLKWKDPNVAMKSLAPHSIELVKAEYVHTPKQLLDIMRRYQPAGIWPLVQEYCPGVGLGQFFYMHEGHAIRRFQHIRVAEWPPEGGFSSVCDSVPLSEHQALQEQSVSLLRSIRWQGVAMVEYRLDKETGHAVLMEINGRYWGSYPLAMHSGASFALLSYYVKNKLYPRSLPLLKDGLRCRMVATEIKRLKRIIFDPQLIADRSFRIEKSTELRRFIFDFLRPKKVRYFVWLAADPWPFVVDIRNTLRNIWNRLYLKVFH